MGKTDALGTRQHELFVPESGSMFDQSMSFTGLIKAVANLVDLGSDRTIEVTVNFNGVLKSHHNDGLYLVGSPIDVLEDMIIIEPLFTRFASSELGMESGLITERRSRILHGRV